jgi:hypothetical protein
MRRSLVGFLLVLLCAPLAQTLSAQGGRTYYFVARLGRDTVAFERVTRTGSRLVGELFTTSPRARRTRYVATLDRFGRVSRIEMTRTAAVDTPAEPGQLIVEEFRDTLATVIVTRGTAAPDTTRMRVRPGAAPFISLSTGLLEQMVIQARRARADSVPIDVVVAGQRQPTPNYVAWRGVDSVAIDYFGAPFYLRVDNQGRVLNLNGMRTTAKFMIDRARVLDYDRLTLAFIERERGGQVAGAMSPRDTARVVLNLPPPTVWVDYSRPMARGRQIFGNVVPWNQVWRTGANNATQLSTPVDLRVGDVTIPAGKYTLWTIPRPDGATLIVNKQTGQWGTEYDPQQDLARFAMRSETLPAPVERFTITVAPVANGGELRFEWDRTRWVLPFTVR